MIIKGEAWKFREKTDQEYELDTVVKQKKKSTTGTPKILETIRLAKASNDRQKVVRTGFLFPNTPEAQRNSPVRPSLLQVNNNEKAKRVSILAREKPTEVPKIDLLESHRNSIKGDEQGDTPTSLQEKVRRTSQKSTFAQLDKEKEKKFKTGLLQKLKENKSVLNFENDFFVSMVKRSSDLSAKYLKDKIPIMAFDRKCGAREVLGEMSLNLVQARSSSVMAYTELHVLYLDQLSYEKVFFAQIEEVKEKLDFFREYFKEISFNVFKRMCFLFTEKKFKLGDTIYKEGSPCDNLYFIKSGEVQV